MEEGLGTKNLVADAVYAATGRCFYREIAIDTVATMVNDLVTCGALPISVAMHAAVGILVGLAMRCGRRPWLLDLRKAA